MNSASVLDGKVAVVTATSRGVGVIGCGAPDFVNGNTRITDLL